MYLGTIVAKPMLKFIKTAKLQADVVDFPLNLLGELVTV